MGIRKLMMIASGIGLTGLIAGPAGAQDDGSQPAIYFTPTSTDVLIRRGSNLQLPMGHDAVDPRTTVTCPSSRGCTITISSVMIENTNDQDDIKICSKVDNVDAFPPCSLESGYEAVSLQSDFNVPYGPHTVQTHVTSSYGTVELHSWQIVYTIYGH